MGDEPEMKDKMQEAEFGVNVRAVLSVLFEDVPEWPEEFVEEFEELALKGGVKTYFKALEGRGVFVMFRFPAELVKKHFKEGGEDGGEKA